MTEPQTSLDPDRPEPLTAPDDSSDPLLDHNYDGIQEYDNPMPAWWTWTFVLTVVWAVAYVILIEVGVIQKYEEELAEGLAEIHALQAAAAAGMIQVDHAYFAAVERTPDRLAEGAARFQIHCAMCHQADGSGLIGPSLLDDEWIHGGTLVDVYTVIRDGATGMVPHNGILTHDQMVNVTLHVETFGATTTPEGFGTTADDPALPTPPVDSAAEAPAADDPAEPAADDEAPGADDAPDADSGTEGGEEDASDDEAPEGDSTSDDEP